MDAPVTSTAPDASRVIVWPMRRFAIDPAFDHVFVAGSYRMVFVG